MLARCLFREMAHGIQYIQATQFIKLPSSHARGIPELRNKKCLNPNLTCGTSIWGRSCTLHGKQTKYYAKIMLEYLIKCH